MSGSMIIGAALADIARSFIGVGDKVDNEVGCQGNVRYATDESSWILVECSQNNVVHAPFEWINMHRFG